jgi:tetratricopeptide (TPR) repeat protein
VDRPELFNEALKNLQAVIDKHRETPLVYLHIGHIYHYQERLRNFRRALDNYMLCYSFAESDPDQALLAAQAVFHAGWLTAAVFGDMQAAIELTKKALACDPRLGEAHYHLAKIYGAFGDTREALFHLQQAVGSFDRRYCLKIEVDDDFRMIREELKKALYELAEKDVADQETWLREHGATLSDALRINAEDKLEDARRFLDTNDYAQVIQAIVLIDGLRKRLAGDLQERELSEEEKERRRRQEDEQRRADEEALQRAAEEARMKEELRQRIEAEMKVRIEAERKKQRRQRFIKALLLDALLILLALTLGSFIMYGVTVGGFVLILLTGVFTVAWLCL